MLESNLRRTNICKVLEINRTSTYKKDKKMQSLIEDIKIMNIVVNQIDKNNFLSAYSAKR